MSSGLQAGVGPRTIVLPGTGTQTASYVLPPGIFQYVQSVFVSVDATAAPDVRPTLSIAEQSGVVIAAKRQGESILTGTTGTATWALRLDDETPPTPDPFLPVRAAYVRRAAGQIIPNNVLTPITFTTIVYEFGAWIDLIGSPTDLTVPDTGFYVVQGALRWTVGALAPSRRSAWISLNGGLEAGLDTLSIPLALTDMNPVLARRLNAGDILRLMVVQGSGAPLGVFISNISVERVWKV